MSSCPTAIAVDISGGTVSKGLAELLELSDQEERVRESLRKYILKKKKKLIFKKL